MYMGSSSAHNKVSRKRSLNGALLQQIQNSLINNNEEEEQQHQPQNPLLNNEKVSVISNHIYFYTDVNTETILALNKAIMLLNKELVYVKNNIKNEYDMNLDNLKIYLHINSPGGFVTDAFGGVDTIMNSKIPIVSIVEGHIASAATFLSVVCSKRYMTKHSSMLIHQLSGSNWGTYEQMKDNFVNSTFLQKQICDLYMEHSNGKIKKSQLDTFLKRDIMMNFTKCKKLGLVDELFNA